MTIKNQHYNIASKSIVNIISHLTIILTIFSSYVIINYSTIGIGFAILSILLCINKLHFRPREIYALIVFSSYCIFVFAESTSTYHIFQNLRYWYGVIIYILFFITINNTKFISIIFFRIMCISVLFESLLINLLIDSSILHGNSTEIHKLQADGLYERPIGFTGNPGTSAVFLIVLLYFIEIYYRKKPSLLDLLLLILTIIATVSTTGLLILCLYIFIRHVKVNLLSKQLWIDWSLIFILFFAPIFYMMLNINVKYIQKFSIEYVLDVLKVKIATVSSTDNITYLGRQVIIDYPITSGDFGFYNFTDNMGIAGIIVFFIVIYSFNRPGIKILPILLLYIIGSMHYPSMFQPAGQVLTAMILILRFQSSTYKKTINKKYFDSIHEKKQLQD